MWKKLVEFWKKMGRSAKALTIVVAAVVVVVLLFCFLPIMRVSYATEESYLTNETYYVMETYTAEEPYTEQEPYIDIEVSCNNPPCTGSIPFDYFVVDEEGHNYFESDGTPSCSVEVTILNLDLDSGVFNVDFEITVSGGETTTISGSKSIMSGAEQKVIAYYNRPLETLSSFSYTVHAPQKPDPSYSEEEVIKYRDVTVIGEVTKERYTPELVTVLKTQEVTKLKRVSMLDYLMNY